ncbi:MAG: hypothetical protein JWO97_2272 [Acidobacteria bacterium]|nr:hypothetical protein [Acidobacteriota bacterium]
MAGVVPPTARPTALFVPLDIAGLFPDELPGVYAGDVAGLGTPFGCPFPGLRLVVQAMLIADASAIAATVRHAL